MIYGQRMSIQGAVDIKTRRASVQATVSVNVKVMMAVRGLDQAGIAAIIDLSPGGVGHKLNGRARWSIEEVEALAEAAGWDVARFFAKPSGYSPEPGLPVSSG